MSIHTVNYIRFRVNQWIVQSKIKIIYKFIGL